MEPTKTDTAVKMDTAKMGVFIKGLIANKNEYIPKGNGDIRYTLDIAVPGNRHNIPVSVDRKVFEEANVFTEYTCRVVVSTFNGATYFQRAA
jgi:hypothetical protein